VHEPYGDDRTMATVLHRASGFPSSVTLAGRDLSAAEYNA